MSSLIFRNYVLATKPRSSNTVVDNFKLKDGSPEKILVSQIFYKQSVDAFARTVIVGNPEKPLVWTWHAIEICGGWGGIGKAMERIDYTVVNVELKL